MAAMLSMYNASFWILMAAHELQMERLSAPVDHVVAYDLYNAWKNRSNGNEVYDLSKLGCLKCIAKRLENVI